MKNFIIIFFMLLVLNVKAQTINVKGVEYGEKSAPKTEKQLTDGCKQVGTLEGSIVYLSKSGKPFIIKTSKKGTPYRKYLKAQTEGK